MNTDIFSGTDLNTGTFEELISDAMAQPTAEEMETMKTNEMIDRLVVSMTTAYPTEEYLLYVNETGVAARRDLVCIKAKQKSGKSSLIAVMIAAILCGQWGKVKRGAERLKLLYVDTEMKELDTQLILRKALHMAGLPENEDVAELVAVNLRSLSITDCNDMLPKLLERFQPDIVFVDGIVDMCTNFNELETSQQLVQSHMTLAELFDCCLIEVLHTNKSLDDHNMRGHLGSFLSQKCSTVIECTKDASTNIVTVKCSECRHAPFDEFYFGFDRDGNITSADERMAQLNADKLAGKQAQKDREEKERRAKEESEVTRIVKENGGAISKSYLVNQLVAKEFCKQSQGYNIINRLLTAGFLMEKPGTKVLVLTSSMDGTQTEMNLD